MSKCSECGGSGKVECDERGNMYEEPYPDCEYCKGTGVSLK